MELYNHSIDKRWSVFHGPDCSWEQFQELALPRLDLIDTVNEEVKKRYRVLHKLLAFSFYEYEFYDIAAAQMATMMEMALSIRYKELTNEEWHIKGKGVKPKRDLKNLFFWIKERGLIEFDIDHQLDVLRDSRNYFAHPKRHNFSGGANKSRIEQILMVINNLYDPLFASRKSLSNELICWFADKLKKRFVVRLSEHLVPLVAVELVFVDNSYDVPEYQIACFPCIDLDAIDRTSPYSVKTMLLLRINQVNLTPENITGINSADNLPISIAPCDESMRQTIEEWEKKLNSIENEFNIQMVMWRNSELIDAIHQSRINYFKNANSKLKSVN